MALGGQTNSQSWHDTHFSRPLGSFTNVGTPTDFAITVTALNRGLFLSRKFLPRPSFVHWTGDVTLTPAQPSGELWRAGG